MCIIFVALFTPLRFLLRILTNKIGDRGAMVIGEALKNCVNLKKLTYVDKLLLTVTSMFTYRITCYSSQ